MCFDSMESIIFYRSYINSSKCPRCGLQINERESKCPHCSNLSDLEARKLKPELKVINNKLGKTFIYLFILVVILMLLTLV